MVSHAADVVPLMNHFVPPAGRFTSRRASNFLPETDALRNFLIIFQSLMSGSAAEEFQLYRKAIGRLKFFCLASFLNLFFSLFSRRAAGRNEANLNLSVGDVALIKKILASEQTKELLEQLLLLCCSRRVIKIRRWSLRMYYKCLCAQHNANALTYLRLSHKWTGVA